MTGQRDDLVAQRPIGDGARGGGVLEASASASRNSISAGPPRALQLGGDEPIVGVDLVVLPLRQCGLVALSFDLLKNGRPWRWCSLPCAACGRATGHRFQQVRRPPGKPARRRQRRRRHVRSGIPADPAGCADDCRRTGRRPCSGRTSCARSARSRRCPATATLPRAACLCSSWPSTPPCCRRGYPGSPDRSATVFRRGSGPSR